MSTLAGLSREDLEAQLARALAERDLLLKQRYTEATTSPNTPEPVDRRLGQTEEGRTQRILLATLAILAAVLAAFSMQGLPTTEIYALLGTVVTALISNAYLGGKRQQAKAIVSAARSRP